MNLPKIRPDNSAVLTRHPDKLSCNAGEIKLKKQRIKAKIRRQQLNRNLLFQGAIAGIGIGGLAGLAALFFQPTKI